uniref:Uncharacterized protein n=1 Tax=Amphimedon queenslandica TaxID=400682 RepID=A0A1X7VVL6_AMPQE
MDMLVSSRAAGLGGGDPLYSVPPTNLVAMASYPAIVLAMSPDDGSTDSSSSTALSDYTELFSEMRQEGPLIGGCIIYQLPPEETGEEPIVTKDPALLPARGEEEPPSIDRLGSDPIDPESAFVVEEKCVPIEDMTTVNYWDLVETSSHGGSSEGGGVEMICCSDPEIEIVIIERKTNPTPPVPLSPRQEVSNQDEEYSNRLNDLCNIQCEMDLDSSPSPFNVEKEGTTIVDDILTSLVEVPITEPAISGEREEETGKETKDIEIKKKKKESKDPLKQSRSRKHKRRSRKIRSTSPTSHFVRRSIRPKQEVSYSERRQYKPRMAPKTKSIPSSPPFSPPSFSPSPPRPCSSSFSSPPPSSPPTPLAQAQSTPFSSSASLPLFDDSAINDEENETFDNMEEKQPEQTDLVSTVEISTVTDADSTQENEIESSSNGGEAEPVTESLQEEDIETGDIETGAPNEVEGESGMSISLDGNEGVAIEEESLTCQERDRDIFKNEGREESNEERAAIPEEEAEPNNNGDNDDTPAGAIEEESMTAVEPNNNYDCDTAGAIEEGSLTPVDNEELLPSCPEVSDENKTDTTEDKEISNIMEEEKEKETEEEGRVVVPDPTMAVDCSTMDDLMENEKSIELSFVNTSNAESEDIIELNAPTEDSIIEGNETTNLLLVNNEETVNTNNSLNTNNEESVNTSQGEAECDIEERVDRESCHQWTVNEGESMEEMTTNRQKFELADNESDKSPDEEEYITEEEIGNDDEEEEETDWSKEEKEEEICQLENNSILNEELNEGEDTGAAEYQEANDSIDKEEATTVCDSMLTREDDPCTDTAAISNKDEDTVGEIGNTPTALTSEIESLNETVPETRDSTPLPPTSPAPAPPPPPVPSSPPPPVPSSSPPPVPSSPPLPPPTVPPSPPRALSLPPVLSSLVSSSPVSSCPLDSSSPPTPSSPLLSPPPSFAPAFPISPANYNLASPISSVSLSPEQNEKELQSQLDDNEGVLNVTEAFDDDDDDEFPVQPESKYHYIFC